MSARGMRIDAHSDSDTALSRKAFHIDAADPYLDKA